MDANEALDVPILWYLRLFRRHLLLMHFVHLAVTLVLVGVLWAIGGTTVVLWTIGLWIALSVVAAIAGGVARRRGG